VKMWLKIALNAVRLPKFEPVNGISWSPRKMRVKDLRQRLKLAARAVLSADAGLLV